VARWDPTPHQVSRLLPLEARSGSGVALTRRRPTDCSADALAVVRAIARNIVFLLLGTTAIVRRLAPDRPRPRHHREHRPRQHILEPHSRGRVRPPPPHHSPRTIHEGRRPEPRCLHFRCATCSPRRRYPALQDPAPGDARRGLPFFLPCAKSSTASSLTRSRVACPVGVDSPLCGPHESDIFRHPVLQCRSHRASKFSSLCRGVPGGGRPPVPTPPGGLPVPPAATGR
jgi:hypothetical protein